MRTWTRAAALLAGAVVISGTSAIGAAWAVAGQDPSGADRVPTEEQTSNGGPVLGPDNATFVAIAPCRLVDTRVAGGPFTDREIRRFDVGGTGSWFAAQGGQAGGCDIPAYGITAVEVTVTAVDAAGTGFVRLFPTSVGSATFMNYTSSFNPSNTGAVVVCQGAGGGCFENEDLGVRTYGNDTDLVIDVQGYYATPMSVAVDATGTVLRGSRHVQATTKLGGDGQYSVKFDRSVQNCTFLASLGSGDSGGLIVGQVQAQQNAIDDQAVFVGTYDSAGGRADKDFMLQVTC